jgi:hypothetical protein
VFDRSFLPEAVLEFVVLTDTHYMVDPGDAPLEFESRRKQTARVEHALRLATALGTPFMVHLGDLVQEYPGTELYARALAEARAQLARHGATIRHAAGNQDVGDKPDPTMPTLPVTSASLAAYHAVFGPSWYSFDAGGAHFVVLNSSILNAPLPETAAQRAWLEADLAAHDAAHGSGSRRHGSSPRDEDLPEAAHGATHRNGSGRIFVFLHHPPYLYDEREPGLGHYDNIGESDRGWLLTLLRRHDVELLFTGHSHFAWFDRIGHTRYFVGVSTSFTRPGFGEVFSSGPAPERGRDDAAKLGFYLVRVQPDGIRVHFIRTGGEMASPSDLPGTNTAPRLLTRLPRDLPASPLGVVLCHPLSPVAEVPLAWPSAVRQRVRNDYPLLACLELGARHVRLPATDLDDPLQRRRLSILRDEGVAVTATWLWHERLAPVDLAAAAARHAGVLDTMEVQLAGALWPEEAVLEQITTCRAAAGVSLALAPLIPKERVAGKQHLRTRIGYRVAELPELDRRLSAAGARLDRVLCWIDPGASPWDVAQEFLALPPLEQIGAVDWLVTLPAGAEGAYTARAAEAIFAAVLLAGGRVYLEPLVDLDRTMDASHGLLDRRCNPRPAFHAVRCLNTILYSRAGAPVGTPSAETLAASASAAGPEARNAGDRALAAPSSRVLIQERAGQVYRLFLPPEGTEDTTQLVLEVSPAAGGTGVRDSTGAVARYHLTAGTCESAVG